jgi:2-polyprenyl-3-methyl-5-hydroxy-6-metoxy-1,4-benzoquinol methylase
MTTMTLAAEDVALASRGESSDAIYRAAAAALRDRGARGALVDVGCGTGRLLDYVRGFTTSYTGVDIVRYGTFPPEALFAQTNLDREMVPLTDGCADVICALEVIEHLENPRVLCRELTRLLRPGGWLAVSTPNQLSLGSLVCLAVRGQHAAFQPASYPSHRTALLPIDLVRIAQECGLDCASLEYTRRGRVPFTSIHYPGPLSRWWPRGFSDNVILVARKPA